MEALLSNIIDAIPAELREFLTERVCWGFFIAVVIFGRLVTNLNTKEDGTRYWNVKHQLVVTAFSTLILGPIFFLGEFFLERSDCNLGQYITALGLGLILYEPVLKYILNLLPIFKTKTNVVQKEANRDSQ